AGHWRRRHATPWGRRSVDAAPGTGALPVAEPGVAAPELRPGDAAVGVLEGDQLARVRRRERASRRRQVVPVRLRPREPRHLVLRRRLDRRRRGGDEPVAVALPSGDHRPEDLRRQPSVVLVLHVAGRRVDLDHEGAPAGGVAPRRWPGGRAPGEGRGGPGSGERGEQEPDRRRSLHFASPSRRMSSGNATAPSGAAQPRGLPAADQRGPQHPGVRPRDVASRGGRARSATPRGLTPKRCVARREAGAWPGGGRGRGVDYHLARPTMARYVHGYATPEQERLVAQAEHWRELIRDGAPLAPGTRLLEVGCGVGAVLAVLGREYPGVRLSGVDIEQRQLDFARGHLARAGVEATLTRADALALPFADESFDHVWMMWFLEHVPDPPAALREARRVLAPGGAITAIEVDYATCRVEPSTPAVEALLDAMVRGMAASGWSDAGTRLPGWLDEAGFHDVEPGERTFWWQDENLA